MGGGMAARLRGAWRYGGRTIEGRLRTDRGGEPVGLIIYDPSGHMSVQIMPGREQRLASPISQFLSYFGTYTIDEGASTVTHHRHGDIRPHAPTDVVRQYRVVAHRPRRNPAGTAPRDIS